jgi:hypothetical protein
MCVRIPVYPNLFPGGNIFTINPYRTVTNVVPRKTLYLRREHHTCTFKYFILFFFFFLYNVQGIVFEYIPNGPCKPIRLKRNKCTTVLLHRHPIWYKYIIIYVVVGNMPVTSAAAAAEPTLLWLSYLHVGQPYPICHMPLRTTTRKGINVYIHIFVL